MMMQQSHDTNSMIITLQVISIQLTDNGFLNTCLNTNMYMTTQYIIMLNGEMFFEALEVLKGVVG